MPVHWFRTQYHVGLVTPTVSVLWLVCVTNAFNLVDGLDGLSAGLALISAGSLIPIFITTGQTGPAVAASILAGAVLGFLPYNLHPARIFLGDTGATAIGFALAWLSLRGGSTLSAGFATLLPVIVLGVPVADTLLSMARRLLRAAGRRPDQMVAADRAHVHHRLLDLGLDHRRAVLILYLVGLSLAVTALVSVFMTTQEAGLLLVGLLLAGFVGVGRLGYQEFGVIRSGIVLRFYDAPVLHRSLFVVFFDLVFVALSVYLAVGLKYDDWALVRYRAIAVDMVAVLVPCTVAVLWLMRLYQRAWRHASVYDVVRLCVAVGLAAFLGFLSFRLVSGQVASLSLFCVYALLKTGVANASRLSYRVLHSTRVRASASGARTLIYGAGRGGTSALREMLTNGAVGMLPVGFIDDDPQRVGRRVMGLPVVGSVEDLEQAIRSRRAEAVVVATEKVPEERLALARLACERAGARFARMQILFADFDLAVSVPKTTPGVPLPGSLTARPLGEPAAGTLTLGRLGEPAG